MYMKKKYGLLPVIIGATSIIVSSAFAFAAKCNSSIYQQANADDTYTLSIPSFPNDYLSTQDVYTESGYRIRLHLSGYTYSNTHWGTISSNGYLTNDVAISGMKSISINFFDDTSEATLKWSWLATNMMSNNLRNVKTTSYKFTQ